MQNIENVFAFEELSRFESLGDNCEFGLVLRHLKSENSGMFRWTLTNVKATTAAIRSDFSGVFEKNNLVPNSKIMIRDTLSGIAFHTDLKSHEADGRLVFLKQGRAWQAQYKKERKKFLYLKEKFRKRVENPGTIFVVKSNRGISPADISDLFKALSEKSGKNVKLIHVQQRRAGNTSNFHMVSPSIGVGYIDRFAPYANADDSLKAQWEVIMRKALDVFPEQRLQEAQVV